jgi:hypothetical protein
VNAAIESARKRFFAAMDAAVALTGEDEAALSFITPGNLAGVVRALNRASMADDPRQVTLADGVLYRTHAPDVPPVDTRVLLLALSSASLARTREVVLDARSAVSIAA